LPHRSNFPNYIENAHKYSKEQIKDIIAYNWERMDHFGFYAAGKTVEGVPIYHPTPNFKDRPLNRKRNGR